MKANLISFNSLFRFFFCCSDFGADDLESEKINFSNKLIYGDEKGKSSASFATPFEEHLDCGTRG